MALGNGGAVRCAAVFILDEPDRAAGVAPLPIEPCFRPLR
jgi:hypothetical protein